MTADEINLECAARADSLRGCVYQKIQDLPLSPSEQASVVEDTVGMLESCLRSLLGVKS